MTNIYVGNLDFATSEDQLRTLFAAYGAVKTVTTVTDRDTGQPRGFAFVEMTSVSRRAIGPETTRFGGRLLGLVGRAIGAVQLNCTKSVLFKICSGTAVRKPLRQGH
jgi:hypothetical protein